MHGVAPVPDHERGRGERAPLAAVRRGAAGEDALQDGGARCGVLADGVEQHVRRPRHAPLGDESREPGERLHQRLADGQRHHQRRERDRAREQRVVEHGHLDHHAAQPLGRERCDLQRRVRAERRAPDHGLLDLQVVEQRDDVLGEEGHRVAPHVRRAVRAAVPAQVERDDPVPALGQGARQRLVHALAEQQAVYEHGHPRPVPVDAVGQPAILVPERPGLLAHAHPWNSRSLLGRTLSIWCCPRSSCV